MASATEIGERLRALTGGAAVSLRLDPHEYADHYFAALSATLRDLGSEPGTHTIYVSVTNPAALVWSLAQALDVPAERLSFVDAISHIMMNFRDPLPQAVYLESPRMLEVLMLRIEYLLRKRPSTRPVVIVDSVNSLAIHDSPDLLSEFFHILLNNLKSRQVLTVLLTTSGDGNPTIDEMLSLVVDETIDVSARAGVATVPFSTRLLGLPEFDEPIARLLPNGWVALLIGETGAGMQLFAKQFAHVGTTESPGFYYTTYERVEDVRRTYADYGWSSDGLAITNITERYQIDVLDREIEVARARERGLKYADIAGVVSAGIPPQIPKPTARILADLATVDAPFRLTIDTLDFLLEVLPPAEVVALARQIRRRCLALGGQSLLALQAEVHDRHIFGLLEDLSDIVLDLRSVETKDGFQPVLTVRKVRNHPEQTRRVRLTETSSGFSVEA